MNCINCGHPLSKNVCEYCGTSYPNFKIEEPEKKMVQVCFGMPNLFYDHDIFEMKSKMFLKCSDCNFCTKKYAINYEDFDWSITALDFFEHPVVENMFNEFRAHQKKEE